MGPWGGGGGWTEQAPYLSYSLEPTLFTPEVNGRTSNAPIHMWRMPSAKGEHLRTSASTNQYKGGGGDFVRGQFRRRKLRAGKISSHLQICCSAIRHGKLRRH